MKLTLLELSIAGVLCDRLNIKTVVCQTFGKAIYSYNKYQNSNVNNVIYSRLLGT